jgi:ATP-dependent DNA ligase
VNHLGRIGDSAVIQKAIEPLAGGSVVDTAGVRLVTRNGFDLAGRFPLAGAAIASLPARSCVVDCEAIACDDNGLAVFDLIRYRRQDAAVTLCAFDLLELGSRSHRRRKPSSSTMRRASARRAGT